MKKLRGKIEAIPIKFPRRSEKNEEWKTLIANEGGFSLLNPSSNCFPLAWTVFVGQEYYEISLSFSEIWEFVIYQRIRNGSDAEIWDIPKTECGKPLVVRVRDFFLSCPRCIFWRGRNEMFSSLRNCTLRSFLLNERRTFFHFTGKRGD